MRSGRGGCVRGATHSRKCVAPDFRRNRMKEGKEMPKIVSSLLFGLVVLSLALTACTPKTYPT